MVPEIPPMKKQPATLLCAELRGLTEAIRDLAPHALQDLLESYLDNAVAAIEALEGTMLHHVGAGLLVAFGPPSGQNDHALRALVCAADMQQRHRIWCDARRAAELVAPGLAVGVGTGPVTAGALAARPDNYVAFGQAIHESIGLCARAEAGQILITPDVHTTAASRRRSWSAAVPPMTFASLGARRFKNVETPVEVVAVLLKLSGSSPS